MEEEDENGTGEAAEGKDDQQEPADLELFPGGLELPVPRKAATPAIKPSLSFSLSPEQMIINIITHA